MSDHTSKQFDADLEAIRTRVLQMGGLVEAQIRRAIEACSSDGDRDAIGAGRSPTSSASTRMRGRRRRRCAATSSPGASRRRATCA